MKSIIQVKSAVYGVLDEGNAARSVDVTRRLQEQIDASNGVVTINNGTMGSDPAFGTLKHFRATVSILGTDQAFTCQEGETVDFSQGGHFSAGQMVSGLKGILG